MVYEAALLLEKGLESKWTRSWSSLPYGDKCKRVRLRDGLPEEAFRSESPN